MADLNTAIDNFEAASKGTDVKAALIALLETLSILDVDVDFLNKQGLEYYVLQETINSYEYSKLAPFRGLTNSPVDPENPSPALMTGGNLYNFFTPILNKLRAFAGLEEHEIHAGDIQALLTYIHEYIYDSNVGIKSAIESNKSKITGDNIVIPDTESLMDYGNRILEIDKGSPLDVSPLKVDKLEGTYTAEAGKAFNPIVVDVPLKIGVLDAPLNDTYDAREKGYDVWGSVIAHVPVEDPNKTGSGSGSSTGKKGDGTGTDSKYNLVDKVVNSNGEYSASSEEPPADGYSSIDTTGVSNYYVDPNKRYEVIFQDHNGKELKRIPDVQAGTSVPRSEWPAAPTHEATGDIWVFDCWNPQPIYVLGNMTCVAKFSRYQGPPVIHTSSTPGNYVTESWEEICSSYGTNVPVGAIKPLFIPGAGFIRMKKVNNVESDASSVWMSMDRIGDNNSPNGNVPFTNAYDDLIDSTKIYSWENSLGRQWLNSTFISDFLPECLQETITYMNKYHVHTDDGTHFKWHNTRDRIWPLSIQELGYYWKGENLDEWGIDCPNFGDNGFTYCGPYFQEHFGSNSLTRATNSSWYSIFRNMNIQGYPNASIREKLECMLPHHNDEEFTYYDPDTGDSSVLKNFDILSAAEKINQLHHYSLPMYDLAKFMDYQNDIPKFGGKYNPSGYDYLDFSDRESGRVSSVVLRDSAPQRGGYGYLFSTNICTFGWNDGASRDLPMIGELGYMRSDHFFRDIISTQNIDYAICFGLGKSPRG